MFPIYISKIRNKKEFDKELNDWSAFGNASHHWVFVPGGTAYFVIGGNGISNSNWA